MSLGSSPEGGEQKPGGRLQDAWKKREKPVNIDPDQIDWTKMEPLPDADIPFGLSDHPSETNGADPWQTGDHEKVLDGIRKSNERNRSCEDPTIYKILTVIALAVSAVCGLSLREKTSIIEKQEAIIRQQQDDNAYLKRRNTDLSNRDENQIIESQKKMLELYRRALEAAQKVKKENPSAQ